MTKLRAPLMKGSWPCVWTCRDEKCCASRVLLLEGPGDCKADGYLSYPVVLESEAAVLLLGKKVNKLLAAPPDWVAPRWA
jgi:hypothetical protein